VFRESVAYQKRRAKSFPTYYGQQSVLIKANTGATFGEKRLTQATGAVEAATHSIDSLLGIVLTLIIFEGSLLITHYVTFFSEGSMAFSFIIVILVVISVMAWIVGILLQNWQLKFMAWGLGLWLLLIELCMLLYDAVRRPLGTIGVWDGQVSFCVSLAQSLLHSCSG
jgi:hypothetical protein